jgi:hypothetical protein
MKLAVKEIIEECPLPLKVIDHSAKFEQPWCNLTAMRVATTTSTTSSA